MTAPHTILGIDRDATRDEIRAAWRALVRRTHPDVIGQSASAADRTKAINAAHDAMLEALGRAGGRTQGADKPTAPTASRSAASPRMPQRMVPGPAMTMRMKAALVGRLRQHLNRETARLGGAAYTVPGHGGWKCDAAVMVCGGLPAQHLVTRIEIEGRAIRLILASRPASGRTLIALPRLRQTETDRIRQELSAVVLDLDLPENLPDSLPLSVSDISRCVTEARGIRVELHYPSEG